MKTQKKSAKGKRNYPLTPRQKKLIAQIPAIASGEKSKAKAMRDAGYSEKMSLQQSDVLGSPRIRSAMQEALGEAKVDLPLVAKTIFNGLKALNGSGKPDHHARHKFVVTAAELHDAYPAKKHDLNVTSVDDLIKNAESSTPDA